MTTWQSGTAYYTTWGAVPFPQRHDGTPLGQEQPRVLAIPDVVKKRCYKLVRAK